MGFRIKSALAFGISGLEVLLAACSGGTATPMITPITPALETIANPDCEKVLSSKKVGDEITVKFYYKNPPEFSPNFGIYTELGVKKRTVTADIQLSVSDENRDLDRVSLYEDGKKIRSLSNEEVAGLRYFTSTFTVEHYTPGSHVYFGEAVDACGSLARSKELVLTFTGIPIDEPPRLDTMHVDADGNLIVGAADLEGDNRGIAKAILYQNGVIVANFNGGGKTMWKDRFQLPQTVDKSEYVIEVHDLGGNVERSRVTVNFQR